jgi:hypothetical protein
MQGAHDSQVCRRLGTGGRPAVRAEVLNGKWSSTLLVVSLFRLIPSCLSQVSLLLSMPSWDATDGEALASVQQQRRRERRGHLRRILGVAAPSDPFGTWMTMVVYDPLLVVVRGRPGSHSRGEAQRAGPLRPPPDVFRVTVH